MKRNVSLVVVALVAALLTTVAESQLTQAQVVLNPSFESGSTSWSLTGSVSVRAGGTLYGVTSGTNLLAFNTGQQSPTGVASQTLFIDPAKQYSLTLDVGAFSVLNQSAQALNVDISTGTGNRLVQQSVTVNPPGVAPGTFFTNLTVSFQSAEPVVVLKLTDVSSSTLNVDLLVDNIRVTESIPTPPPTPPYTKTLGFQWDPNPVEDRVTEYRLYELINGTRVLRSSVAGDKLFTTVEKVGVGAHTYVATASNIGGEGPASPEVTAVIIEVAKPAPVGGLQVIQAIQLLGSSVEVPVDSELRW